VLNFNDEIWKDMQGYEGQYQVSSHGRIRSIVNNHGAAKIRLKATYVRSTTCQYEYVNLSVKNKAFTEAVHRAVAKAFIPNPENKPMVNHIDGNKLNNNVCNLEWVTDSENKRHAFEAGLMKGQTHWKGKKFSNTSRYHNVGWDKSRNKWTASLKLNGKSHTKRFADEDDAALYVNHLLDRFNITDRARNIIN
jgi:hypothetical protein